MARISLFTEGHQKTALLLLSTVVLRLNSIIGRNTFIRAYRLVSRFIVHTAIKNTKIKNENVPSLGTDDAFVSIFYNVHFVSSIRFGVRSIARGFYIFVRGNKKSAEKSKRFLCRKFAALLVQSDGHGNTTISVFNVAGTAVLAHHSFYDIKAKTHIVFPVPCSCLVGAVEDIPQML